MFRRVTGSTLLFILAALLMLPGSGVSADTVGLSAEQLRGFVVSSEMREEDDTDIPVYKWTSAWRIYLLPGTSRILEKQSTSELLSEFSRLTGLQVGTARDLNEATIVLSNASDTDALLSDPKFLDWFLGEQKGNSDVRDAIKSVIRNNASCTWLYADSEGRTERAIVHVSSEKTPERTDHCLARAFLKSAGLRGEPSGIASVLSDDDASKLSPYDEEALKILYDPRIKVGLTLHEFLQSAASTHE